MVFLKKLDESFVIAIGVVYHRKWKSGDGPIKDAYNIGENPQYSLEIQSGDKDPTIWLLLTRHITDRVCNLIFDFWLIHVIFFLLK